MDTTTTREALEEFAQQVTLADVTGQMLGISPCQALEMAFPAIVGNDDIMAALAAMLDPAIETLSIYVQDGRMTPDEAEAFLHGVFHLLQVSAALGHTIGVHDVLGEVTVPDSLEDIPWGLVSMAVEPFLEDDEAPEATPEDS